MMHALDLLEPEETVGNLWHNMATRIGAERPDAEAAVHYGDVRGSVAILFRALGGNSGVEILEAPAAALEHRTDRLRRIGTPREIGYVASFDGERLRLPPVMDAFPTQTLNRQAYLWLAAMASHIDLPTAPADP